VGLVGEEAELDQFGADALLAGEPIEIVGSGEGVTATILLGCAIRDDQAQISLRDEGRGLDGLVGLLLTQPLVGELAHLLVGEWPYFLAGPCVDLMT
jgi:hypothetical protein